MIEEMRAVFSIMVKGLAKFFSVYFEVWRFIGFVLGILFIVIIGLYLYSKFVGDNFDYLSDKI